MSDWIEAAEQATTRLGYEASSEAWAFLDGARWQREALLTPEAVERAARAMYWQANEWEDGQIVWETPEQIAEEIEEWVPLARAALTAAMGGDDEG